MQALEMQAKLKEVQLATQERWLFLPMFLKAICPVHFIFYTQEKFLYTLSTIFYTKAIGVSYCGVIFGSCGTVVVVTVPYAAVRSVS